MTIEEIYHLAIKKGIEADPRDLATIKKNLSKEKVKFEKLSKQDKIFYDQDNLFNPYADSRVLFAPKNQQVKTILAGIDIEESEILLADKLSGKNKIDLALSHHPSGKALANLSEIMPMQAEHLADLGLPVNVVEYLLEERQGEINRKISPINHFKAVDTAKILGVNFMCLHTVLDNLVYSYFKKTIASKYPETLEDICNLIMAIPEYQEAKKNGVSPTIYSGKPSRSAGKIALTEFTGGTSGSKDVYEWMAKQGIGTIVGMHMSEDHRKEAEKYHLNVVIAGHIASDSLGMNLFLDELEKKNIKVIPCAGLIRIKRFK